MLYINEEKATSAAQEFLEIKGSNTKTPLYENLYQIIRDGIVHGDYQAGRKFHSKRSIAKRLGISVITVENAFQKLKLEGYVDAQQRKGYFVKDIGTIPSDTDTSISTDVEEDDTSKMDLQANRANVHEFPVSTWLKLMRKVIAENPPDLFSIVPYGGLPELRTAIANYLLRARGMQVSPSQIIVGAGTEYLYSRLIQLLGSHTKFVFENPGYQKLSQIADNYRVPWTYCNVDKSGILVNRLRQTAGNVVHVSPANTFPGGFSMSIARRRELLAWAYEKEDRYIIEDDYDSELRYEGNNLLPLFARDTNEKVIYLNTFSKTLMPSLRISYIILPNSLLERYHETMSFYSCTVSGFEQRALAKFIDEGYFERHIAKLRTYYQQQRKVVMDAIRSSNLAPISHIIENNAGTHFMLCLDTKLSGAEIKNAVAKNGIKLALLDDYCFDKHPLMEKVLVVNYASLSAGEVGKAVNKLADALTK